MSTAKHILYIIGHNIITRLIVGLVLITSLTLLCHNGLETLFSLLQLPKFFATFLVDFLSGTIAILSYMLLYHFYEQREISEFAHKNMGYNILLGTLWGTLLMSGTMVVIWLWGAFDFQGVQFDIDSLIVSFGGALFAALFEEILFRGIIYRLIEEKLGTWIAIILSSLLFGLVHYFNPNGNLWISLILTLQAGLLFSIAYAYARNLWFPIAIHFAWDFVLSGVFDTNLSGLRQYTNSIIVGNINGPIWLTGGEWGPEVSLPAILLCSLMSCILIYLSYRKKRINSPFWKV